MPCDAWRPRIAVAGGKGEDPLVRTLASGVLARHFAVMIAGVADCDRHSRLVDLQRADFLSALMSLAGAPSRIRARAAGCADSCAGGALSVLTCDATHTRALSDHDSSCTRV